MVGDNPVADIKGGKEAGFYTCWLNRFNATLPAGIEPDCEVHSLSQLEALFDPIKGGSIRARHPDTPEFYTLFVRCFSSGCDIYSGA